jgi:hypothetical protein
VSRAAFDALVHRAVKPSNVGEAGAMRGPYARLDVLGSQVPPTTRQRTHAPAAREDGAGG